YAWYDRYAPTDPLCCPSSETGVTFHVERAAAGPVVIPDSVMAQASPSTAAAATSAPESGLTAVCVNLGTGGDSLAKVNWTREEITAHEARFGPVPEPHPATGTCSDPAGLPVTPGAINEFSWLCFRTFDGRWYGPDWTADMYRTGNEVPPDPAIGGCPQPRATEIPLPPPSEQAAATAVYLSQLEAAGDLDTLVAWLHPDAQTAVSRSEVIDWYT